MDWHVTSDVGCVRKRNEDAYAVFALPDPVSGRVFAVADGLGGQQAGDVASRMAIEQSQHALHAWAAAVRERLERQPAQSSHEALDDRALSQALAAAIEHAHHALLNASRSQPSLRGMGSTLTIVRFHAGRYQFAHVGDSRFYRLRARRLEQLTKDHALVAELLRSGELDERQAQHHPSRHVLTQALGSEGALFPDVGWGAWQAHDRFLLCTDGLTSVVSDHELAQLVAEYEPVAATEKLLQTALERGAPDNLTVMVIAPGSNETRREQA